MSALAASHLMDISQYAVGAEDIDALSAFQIANFFRRHKSIAKDDCDRAAAKIIGSSTVSPTLVQGAASYTVTADANRCSKVVQFRRSTLDLELISQARQTYGGFVPNCKAHGMLADVYVYEADLVPGVAFSWARRQLLAPAMEDRLLRTVRDLARFFASAWINRCTLELAPNTAGELFAHYSQILNQLSQKLPERFHQKLTEVRQGLSLLFRPDYPIVLNHDDLLEMNIHVDEETGRITGIVDWADAKIAPFGLSLGGLETILGVQTASSWLFHPNHEQLRIEFWKTFYEFTGDLSDDDRQAIQVGRLLGLFRTHGFDRRPEKANAAPLEEGDQELVCLEAFCLQ
ncbi:hypothetical protein ACRE_011350 [Hapsidospora chrysogenum ATCC 11550]|uniref:Aminoglycoside phosphotransferase domain-containing protein n=1 Tax=Hapsidospora chrysogenum (strain ATCC 11550 / CBS 779.69 / DSM 880 / IAM 14645 / JCM 23072 / IMI 49137) TaxID=857340 RepID=A0A086TEX3_HAPC1|nr:hypothetical protein ACRE_011350 [Hapsidospora chrysogenum ATCC 11550]